MPKRKTMLAAEANTARMPAIPKELIDPFVTDGPMTAEAVNAASLAFKKALIELALGAELSHHRGFAAGEKRQYGLGRINTETAVGHGRMSSASAVP